MSRLNSQTLPERIADYAAELRKPGHGRLTALGVVAIVKVFPALRRQPEFRALALRAGPEACIERHCRERARRNGGAAHAEAGGYRCHD